MFTENTNQGKSLILTNITNSNKKDFCFWSHLTKFWIHQRILKKNVAWFPQNIKQHNCFIIDNKKCFLSAKSALKTRIMTAEISALTTYILNCNNISQFYCFYGIFNQINAVLVRKRNYKNKLTNKNLNNHIRKAAYIKYIWLICHYGIVDI